MPNLLNFWLQKLPYPASRPESGGKTLKISYCYSHKDEEIRCALDKHLAPLKHQGFIETWCDRKIQGGTDWPQEIVSNLKNSDIILLLVSPNFLDSSYCYETEMPEVLELRRTKRVHVIPILLRLVDLKRTPLANIQFLPSGLHAVDSPHWSSTEEALCDVARNIGLIVEQLRQ